MNKFNHKKAAQALNYFAVRNNGVLNNMKAIKLVWLADRLHLRLYGRMITNDAYLAMKLGPVPSATLNLAKKSAFVHPDVLAYSSEYISPKDNLHYVSVSAVDEKVFSKTDLDILGRINDAFGNMTQWQLSDYSHLFNEWKRFGNELASNPESKFNIDTSDFFEPTDMGDALFDQSADVLNEMHEAFKEQALHEN